jgi:ParB-like chromosome segregation protein Spo0J
MNMATDLTVKILQELRADIARFDLRLTDAVAEIRRLVDSVSIVRGKTDAVRHDVDVALERVRGLEVRVRAIEEMNGAAGE